jgi:hypothetical protein
MLLDRRTFPPEYRRKALVDAFTEINERRNTGRRYRTNPRVVKRGRHNSYIVKKSHHEGNRHDGPPKIRIRALALT